MGLFQKLFGNSKGNESKSKSNELKEITFNVAGVEYDTNKRSRQEILRTAVAHHAKLDSVKSYNGLSDEEIEEGITVFEYKNMATLYLKLELEPDNEYDKNAIKVMTLNTRGGYTTIGYVPREHNIKVGKILNEISSLEGYFYGGKSKTKNNGVIKESDELRGMKVIIKY